MDHSVTPVANRVGERSHGSVLNGNYVLSRLSSGWKSTLIEHLGLTTLIITDLDAKDTDTGKAVSPLLGHKQQARNETLRNWIPAKTGVDELAALPESDKIMTYPTGFSVKSAYQTPVTIKFNGNDEKALSYTFEDALFFKNIPFFKTYNGKGLGALYKKSLYEATSFDDLVERIRNDIDKSEKAEFALNLLYDDENNELLVPDYISSGLNWLTEKLRVNEESLAPKSKQLA